MRYFEKLNNEVFYKLGVEFNKYTNREILKYAIGANLYVNIDRDISEKIIFSELNGAGSITICFEDAIRNKDVDSYENKAIDMFNKFERYLSKVNEEKINRFPLIFFRVRNLEQFMNFASKLKKQHYKYITGFIFPKIDARNGEKYFEFLEELIIRNDEILYAMPIIENEKVIYKESRVNELIELERIFEKYKNRILNIRVGGTDFSSKYGLRRSYKSSIYDISVVNDCLIDVVNIFLREKSEFIISAPVWEYFSNDANSKEIQGLINEINKDKENGFYGKTAIHPSQVKYINEAYIVTYEEYMDAVNILECVEDGGVFKGHNSNKMNEVKPHINWAKKVIARANVFGVLKENIMQERLYCK